MRRTSQLCSASAIVLLAAGVIAEGETLPPGFVAVLLMICWALGLLFGAVTFDRSIR